MAIISKLSAVELKGRDHEKVERMHFKVKHAVSLMESAGSAFRFAQDMYIVKTLFSKLSPALMEKWNEYAEARDPPIVQGSTEWAAFRDWLSKDYMLAKRARVSAGLPTTPPVPQIPVKPALAKPICGKCRKIGHRAQECPEVIEKGAVYVVEEDSADEQVDG